MLTTPQETKRSVVKELFLEYIEKELITLEPIKIDCSKLIKNKNASVSFSFRESGKPIQFKSILGDNFAAAIFNKCRSYYLEEYNSLSRVEFHSLLRKDTFNMTRATKDSSLPHVLLSLSVDKKSEKHEFREQQQSIIFSGFCCVLSSLEFYINCELCRDRINFLISDAEKRQRHDLVSKYRYDMSHLVEVSHYA